jgi:hypothetical protein
LTAGHRRPTDRQVRHQKRGYVVWHRFTVVFVPALLALALLAVGAYIGVVPVALAIEGKQGVRATAKTFVFDGTATFPGFFQTQDGQNRTVVPVTLRNLRIQGVCVSTKVPTPLGDYVLRITSPDVGSMIQVGDVTFGVDTIDRLDFGGDSVNLNYGARTADGTPTDTGTRGYVPFEVNNLKLGLDLNIRYVTANQLHLNGLTLAGSTGQRECY